MFHNIGVEKGKEHSPYVTASTVTVGTVKSSVQHSKLTFSKSHLLATFNNCKMVTIKKFSCQKKRREGHFMMYYTKG